MMGPTTATRDGNNLEVFSGDEGNEFASRSTQSTKKRTRQDHHVEHHSSAKRTKSNRVEDHITDDSDASQSPEATNEHLNSQGSTNTSATSYSTPLDRQTRAPSSAASEANRETSGRSKPKCDNCRRKKVRCRPRIRRWPQDGKCDSCEKSGLPCGRNIQLSAPLDYKDSHESPAKIYGEIDLQPSRNMSAPPQFSTGEPGQRGLALGPHAQVASPALGGKHAEGDWEKMKENFRQMYIIENHSLRRVTTLMKEKYNFVATERQWERKKEQWGFSKYEKRDSRPQAPIGNSQTPSTSVLVRHPSALGDEWSHSHTSEVGVIVPSPIQSNALNTNGRHSMGAQNIPEFRETFDDGENSSAPLILQNQARGSAQEPNIFKAQPLLTRDSIRILKLLPGDAEDEIQCELHTVSIEDPRVHYEALSYSWGDYKDTAKIIVNALFFTIGPNLRHALQAIRLNSAARDLWVDAICIDQSNVEEKNLQIPLMSKIYSGASRVLAWLGSATGDTALALELIHKITDLYDFDDLANNPALSKHWLAFVELTKRPYWNRIWVLQELAVAKRAVVYVGKQELELTRLTDALSLISSQSESLHKAFERSVSFDNKPTDIQQLKNFSATRVVETSGHLVRKMDNGNVAEYLLPLETLLSISMSLKATDARDKVYALLGLASDNESMLPDYSIPLFGVYKKFLRVLFKQSQSLDIICQPWAPEGYDLPTWISSMAKGPFRIDPNGQHTRVYADPLVGRLGIEPRAYTASGKTRAKFIFGIGQLERVLFVDGFILGNITAAPSTVRRGCIPAEWTDLAGWKDLNEKPPEAFWRTLVADRKSDSTSIEPPTYFSLACKYAFSQIVKGDDLSTVEMLRTQQCPKQVAEFLRRVQSVVWRRRLMKMDTTLGLAPDSAQVGDLVCILWGLSVPVILRRMEQSGDGLNVEQYQFIGESYIHGMMNSEALQIQNVERPLKTFALI